MLPNVANVLHRRGRLGLLRGRARCTAARFIKYALVTRHIGNHRAACRARVSGLLHNIGNKQPLAAAIALPYAHIRTGWRWRALEVVSPVAVSEIGGVSTTA